jgi:hypothetical protein
MLRRSTALAALVWGILAVPAFASSAALSIATGGAPLEPGSAVLVTWPAGTVGAEADEMELVLSVDGGRTYPVRVTRRIVPTSESFSFLWTVPSLPSANARLALRAGVDEEAEAETIVGVTEDFVIAASPGAAAEELFRVGEEERTRAALDDAPPPRLPYTECDAVPNLSAVSDLLEPPGRGLSPDPDAARSQGADAARAPRAAWGAARTRPLSTVRPPMRL